MKTPLLLIIFNRPEITALVFEEIRKIKPEKLFIAADGPRLNISGEVDKCAAARKIVETIDWPCEVRRNFSEINLGCKKRVSSAIDWFFDQVAEGIILEDDCLPNQSFFYFCERLLEKYRDDERIMHISGDNFLSDRIKIKDDFYFSQYPCIWGWASWRRAWKKYDLALTDFPEFKKNKILLKNIFHRRYLKNIWLKIWQKTFENKIDTWDHQWAYAVIKNRGLCVNPRVNLVANIGFGGQATHTKNNSRLAGTAAELLSSVLKYPDKIAADSLADDVFLAKSLNLNFFKKLRYYF
ncbi:MAG TPA: hypothetical protein VMD74_01485 [Candidatus Methylomirabilis sp.]|nr:hypothetical protein [Candidatus Methylomirabilis sp.]